MAQADLVLGPPGPARNRAATPPAVPPAPPPTPAVAALLGLAAARPPLPLFALPGVEAGHPEERLAALAANVTGLAIDALACLAGRAACDVLAETLWQRVAALEDAPALRAPLPDPAGNRADHRHDTAAEDRASDDDAPPGGCP